ncbi:glycosyltransferase [Pleomorphomonas sp. PLEO]|uniref:glycosyltransferase n=1 Tax=Pleomorphomonas sp. PLEO TaxID=3239306 RepID=UPI00351DD95B
MPEEYRRLGGIGFAKNSGRVELNILSKQVFKFRDSHQLQRVALMAGGKVLHVVASMGYGGIQTWLIDLIKIANKRGVQMDILTYDAVEQPLAKVARDCGSNVYYVRSHRSIFSLLSALARVNRAGGGYKSIHAHNSFQNGLVMLIGLFLRVPVRISHSHNAPVMKEESLPRAAYNATMRCILPVFSTHLFAVSNVAGEVVYGKHWKKSKKSSLAYCGRDFEAYKYIPERAASMREFLGLAPSAQIVGHVGRFHPQKNHAFLIDVFERVSMTVPEAYLVLVGGGDDQRQRELEDYVVHKGLSDRVKFLGARSDANILLQTFDLFILPSLYEGLPLVVLEALSSGRKCLLSNSITHEVDAIPELVTRLELSDGIEAWAGEIVRLIESDYPVTPAEAYDRITESGFSIEKSFETLNKTYSK